MKRIQSACLLQTIRFQPKDDMDRAMAARSVREEVAHYKALLQRNRAQFQIEDETQQPDGSVVIRIRKQYNNYACGEYLQ